MAWTRRQLDEAVTEYQRVLTEAQQAPGSIRTAVGDARRFVRWHDGAFDPRSRQDSRVSSRPLSAERARRARLGGVVSAPKALRTLIGRWNKEGSHSRSGSS